MKPSMSLLNATPSSTALVSAALGTVGTADGRQMLVHGHSPWAIDTVGPTPARPRVPVSAIARTLIVAAPGTPGVQPKLHNVVPVAAFHVVPPSTDTSTPATVPPPRSAEVPVIVIRTPLDTLLPVAGETIVDAGAS